MGSGRGRSSPIIGFNSAAQMYLLVSCPFPELPIGRTAPPPCVPVLMLFRYSVLDKCVPGYYQRRHEDGSICQSTCCNNVRATGGMHGGHVAKPPECSGQPCVGPLLIQLINTLSNACTKRMHGGSGLLHARCAGR